MNIEIDFDVFKQLTSLREAETMSYNDVLRSVLNLPPSRPVASPDKNKKWVWKGVELPSGTNLRALYKNVEYRAKIVDGQWILNSTTYNSPSAAASSITEGGINGWFFWQYQLPEDPNWLCLDELRKHKSKRS